jgi:hypothetical protein
MEAQILTLCLGYNAIEEVWLLCALAGLIRLHCADVLVDVPAFFQFGQSEVFRAPNGFEAVLSSQLVHRLQVPIARYSSCGTRCRQPRCSLEPSQPISVLQQPQLEAFFISLHPFPPSSPPSTFPLLKLRDIVTHGRATVTVEALRHVPFRAGIEECQVIALLDAFRPGPHMPVGHPVRGEDDIHRRRARVVH